MGAWTMLRANGADACHGETLDQAPHRRPAHFISSSTASSVTFGVKPAFCHAALTFGVVGSDSGGFTSSICRTLPSVRSTRRLKRFVAGIFQPPFLVTFGSFLWT